MENIFENVYVDIEISKENLNIDDEFDLNIKIINKSNFELCNALIKIDLDVDIFDVVDKRYNECINDFSSIGDIEKNTETTFNVKMKINSLPSKFHSKINANINFHIEEEDELKDFNIISEDYTINFGKDKSISNIEDNDLINIEYFVDDNEVLEGKLINHTLIISNISNIEIENICLKYLENNEIYFVKDSIRVDSIPRINEDLSVLLLGDIDVCEKIKVEFQTRCIEEVKFSFMVDYEALENKYHKKTNEIDIKVLSAGFSSSSFIKTQNKENINVNEVVEFKIEFINIGNTVAKNVIIKDDLAKELLFLKGSLYINNKNFDYDIFEDGIIFDKIEPLQKISIKYKAKALDLSEDIKECATIIYKDKVIKSSTSDLSVNGVKINILKEVSSTNVHVGDIISARILIENKGNIDIESLKIIDNVNSSFEFVKDSLKINNDLFYDVESINNFTIRKLNQNERLNITYQLKVIDLPRPNPLIDKTSVNFCYMDNNNIKSGSVSSTKTKIYVNNANLFVEDKSTFLIDNKYTKVCKNKDYALFKFFIENRGNVGLLDVLMKLNLREEIEIDLDTIKVNNHLVEAKNNDIFIGNLNISQNYNIEFFAKVNCVDNYKVEVPFYFEYEFKDLKQEEEFRQVKKFNETLEIIEPKLQIEKFLSDDLIELGDDLVVIIDIKNVGNVDFYDVIIDLNESEFLKSLDCNCLFNGNYVNKDKNLFIDKLRVGDSIKVNLRYLLDKKTKCEEFIDESFVSANYDIYDRRKLKINEKSNKLNLNIRNASISINSKCSSKNVILKEKYTKIFTLLNDGNCDFCDVKLNFHLPDFIKYLKGSMYLNNKKLDINKLKNINIGHFQKNESKNISFEFFIESLPKKDYFSIDLEVDGIYINGEKQITKTFKNEKNIIKIENVELQIAKFTSHDYLQKGDVITIQNIINNTGSIDLEDVLIIDNENQNLDFVEGSVFIDGENEELLNPLNGIKLDLEVSKNMLITYDYEYNPKTYSSRVIHFSDIEYSYKIDGKSKTKKLKSEVIRIDGGLSTFKQFNIDNKYSLYDYEPDLYEIISAQTDGYIESVHEAKSVRSIENESLNGKKVIIKGTLIDRVEYLIKNDKASLYLLERTHPFTTFINIPREYYSEDIDFKVKCDDVFFRLNNKRSLFISSLISIEGVL